MRYDSEIPAFIFDWLDRHSFTDLDAAQQEKVLAHISEEEYEELYQSIAGIRTLKARESNSRRGLIKADLLKRFDEKHTGAAKGKTFSLKPLSSWKAAAVLAIALSGWLYSIIVQQKTQASLPVASVDTLYITKEVAAEPEKIYDTVYLKEEKNRPAGKIFAGTTEKQTVLKHNNNAQPAIRNSSMHIVPVQDFDNTANRQKNNSIKDDSLMRRFTFITL